MTETRWRSIPHLAGALDRRPGGALPDPEREPEFYAGVAFKRAVAWVIDAAVTFAACLLILPFTFFTAIFWWPVLWLCVGFALRWATLSLWSATPGMALMAITIRGVDGQPLQAATAFVHTLGYSISVAVLPLQILSAALMVGLGRGQGLTDLVIGTAAINRPLGGRL